MTDSKRMDPDIVRQINRLWIPVYPGIAAQIARLCDGSPGSILEIGCFSGGIGIDLVKRFPSARLTVALEIDELVRTFATDWGRLLGTGALDRVNVVPTGLAPLELAGGAHDLVICRGVFFFLNETGDLLSEIDRMLAPGGLAFFGGGFGSDTPDSVREELAEESRELNRQLGKRLYSKEELLQLIHTCGLGPRTTIIEEGGLWAALRKPS